MTQPAERAVACVYTYTTYSHTRMYPSTYRTATGERQCGSVTHTYKKYIYLSTLPFHYFHQSGAASVYVSTTLTYVHMFQPHSHTYIFASTVLLHRDGRAAVERAVTQAHPRAGSADAKWSLEPPFRELFLHASSYIYVYTYLHIYTRRTYMSTCKHT